MESSDNYGMLIRILRKRAGLNVRKASQLLGRSTGWLSEIENAVGSARLTEQEFDRIVELLGGKSQRSQFKTWIARIKNQNRNNSEFDGAVLKFIRLKTGYSLVNASKLLKISKGYLSKLENGVFEVSLERRNEMMIAYGYSPSSFKNLSTDPVRSKAVPNELKFSILIRSLKPEDANAFFERAVETLKTGKSA